MAACRALLICAVGLLLASPALAQKGPSAVATIGNPITGITLDEFSETGPNALALDGVTARIESRPGNDGETIAIFIIEEDSSEVLRFEGEPNYFSFLPVTLRLVHIDLSSAQPEVIAASYTGGAHCCERIQIAAVQPDGTWAMSEMGLYDGGYSVYDPNGDGVGEIEVVDQSFLYTFDCYACSYPPSLYYTIADGQLVNVSTRADFTNTYAGALLDFDSLQSMADQPGRVAGWAAVRARLGEGEQALQEIEAQGIATSSSYEICLGTQSTYDCPQGNRRQVGFTDFLRSHLVEQGYMTGTQAPGGKG